MVSRKLGAARVPPTRNVELRLPLMPKSFPVARARKSPTLALVLVTTSASGSSPRNPKAPDTTVLIDGTSSTADSIVPRPCRAEALISKRSIAMRPAVPPKIAAWARIARSGYVPASVVEASSRPVIGTV